MLIYSPFLLSLGSVASLVYLLCFWDAYQHNRRLYQTMSLDQWIKTIVFDITGLLLTAVGFVFARSIVRNNVAVRDLVTRLERASKRGPD